jgi:hypothetical protein
MDVDGDGVPDLDASRVFYLGQSFGGMHGTTFLAVEPAVRLGVLNVAGAPIVDVVRLSVPLRGLASRFLGARTPSLLNGGPAGFNENLPLRNQPPLVDTVAGADAVQEVLDRAIWIDEGGDPIGYASHVRKAPLAGVPAKSVIVQFAKGDQTVPNPATSTLIRAGDLADRTTYFRNDLAYASDPAFPKDPHTFLTRISFPPPVGTVALEAQAQVATFFASDGQTLLDPDGPGPLFETPIAGPLPEELNFLP